jgi:hypothetical protein
LPFKANQDHRHRIPRQRHRVTNWPAYEVGLRARGSLTLWFTAEAVAAWRAEPRTIRDGQPRYSGLAITTALTLRAVFRLALRQTEGLIGSILALLGLDLAVPDHNDVYAAVAARHPDAAVVVPPRSSAVPSEAAATGPTRRDAHLRCIAERGRMGWQTASGYNWRALVESDVARWKRVIGDGLRSQTDGRRATEVAIAADALNRMLGLGRPEYVRVA